MTTDKVFLFLILFSLLISGCSTDNRDLIQYIHQVNSRKSIAIKVFTPIKSIPEFEFPNDIEKRNPLKPLKFKTASDDMVIASQRIKKALEELSLLVEVVSEKD